MPWPCPPSTKTVTHISPFWRLRRWSRGALTPDDTMLRAGKFRSTEPRDMHVVSSERPDTGLKHVVLSRATVHVCDVEGRIECADWWLSGDWPRHSPTAASLGSRTLQVVIDGDHIRISARSFVPPLTWNVEEQTPGRVVRDNQTHGETTTERQIQRQKTHQSETGTRRCFKTQ